MKEKQKYLGLLAILPLLTVAITVGGIDEAMAEEGASVKMSGITQKGDFTYEVIFQVFAGDEDLADGKLLVTSDSSSKEALFRGVSAGSVTGTNTILIIAEDPSSISAEMLSEEKGEFNVDSKSTTGSPWIELSSVNQKGDISYKVIFKIHAGDKALPDGKLLVTTDTQSKEVLFRGVSAGMTAGTGQVLITAKDPSSLSVSMQDIEYEIDFPNHENWKSNLSG